MKRSDLMFKMGILCGIVVTALALDQWTKHLVHRGFKLGESYTVVSQFFDLTYLRNRGAAFSFLDSAPAVFRDPFFTIVPIIAMIIITSVIARSKGRQVYATIALSLIFGGALGNLIDRIQLGYVVDFLYFHWKTVYYWPAFNVADSCIVVGVTMLFIQSLFTKPGDHETNAVGLRTK